MRLAIVIPIFDEQEVLPELMRRLQDACDPLPGITWQVIFASDGSRDDSVRLILQQHQKDPRFTLVELSRNFGHQRAIAAGLAHADADAVVIMDGDLQDPPEVIPLLVEAWRAGGEVVLAQRRSRQERGFRGFCLRAFHRVMTWMSDFPIPPQTGTFSLLDRHALREFNALCEQTRFFPGLRSWIGFEQRVVPYDRPDRSAGAPKQTYRRLIHYALDGILGFSYKPLRLMTYLGLVVSTVGFVMACVFIAKRLLNVETAQTGFTTLITMVLFLGGVQLIGLGLLGEYLGRVFDEVKRRPLFVVRRRHGLAAPPQTQEREESATRG